MLNHLSLHRILLLATSSLVLEHNTLIDDQLSSMFTLNDVLLLMEALLQEVLVAHHSRSCLPAIIINLLVHFLNIHQPLTLLKFHHSVCLLLHQLRILLIRLTVLFLMISCISQKHGCRWCRWRILESLTTFPMLFLFGMVFFEVHFFIVLPVTEMLSIETFSAHIIDGDLPWLVLLEVLSLLTLIGCERSHVGFLLALEVLEVDLVFNAVGVGVVVIDVFDVADVSFELIAGVSDGAHLGVGLGWVHDFAEAVNVGLLFVVQVLGACSVDVLVGGVRADSVWVGAESTGPAVGLVELVHWLD
jgi:hypothetical protein